MSGHHHHNHDQHWLTLLKEETLCHLPYALFSVVVGIIGVGVLTHFIPEQNMPYVGHQLFHGFHYLHLLFAGTGVILSFRKYSSHVLGSLLVGILVPTVFCTLSDAFIPYMGGNMLNISMHFHWCFRDHIFTVLPFLGLGVANGWLISSHATTRRMYFALGSHIFHIVISSMASVLYLVAFGFADIWPQVHLIFIFLFVAVLLPCTFSDIVVPVLFATRKSSSNHDDK